jgi:hypothetical protein
VAQVVLDQSAMDRDAVSLEYGAGDSDSPVVDRAGDCDGASRHAVNRIHSDLVVGDAVGPGAGGPGRAGLGDSEGLGRVIPVEAAATLALAWQGDDELDGNWPSILSETAPLPGLVSVPLSLWLVAPPLPASALSR